MTDDRVRAGADVAALIVAAGRGARFGEWPPKQYRLLRGCTVLERAVRAFLDHPLVNRVLVVIHPDHRTLYDNAVHGLALPEPVIGGATRRDSVHRGLEALASDPPSCVLVHDAARPLVDAETIVRTVVALDGSPCAIAATPARDTLKRVAGGTIVRTIPRDSLWHAQTPQAFRFSDILAAYRISNDPAPTDDAEVAERAGLEVAVVESDARNFKITVEKDLARAEAIVSMRTRVGSGFDVHRFAASGDHVMLCGVAVPHESGLAGHSDADAALHAIVDALLGSVAAGDIGTFFPSHDSRWAGADSALFLQRALDIVTAEQGHLTHLDVTLICQRPHIGPHRAAMRRRLAELLDLPESGVSIKATTTDGLGFTGRGEGIAAHATVTVEFPA